MRLFVVLACLMLGGCAAICPTKVDPLFDIDPEVGRYVLGIEIEYIAAAGCGKRR